MLFRSVEMPLDLAFKCIADYALYLKSMGSRSGTICLSGGEPLLVGLDYMESLLVKVAESRSRTGVPLHVNIQTNATLIDDQWCRCFSDHKVGIGLSVDGTPNLTDKHRIPRNPGLSVSGVVFEAASRLRTWNLPFGVLFVVTASSVGMETQILEYLQSLQPESIAFTPCLDKGPVIAPTAYAEFVSAFFEAWVRLGHVDPEIRMFKYCRQRITDSVQMPIPCEWGNDCPNSICVSADGQVWVCDVFMGRREGHIGDIRRQSLTDIVLSEPFGDFVRARSVLADKCRECEAFEVCRGGCPYRRDDGIDIFCEATLTAFHRMLGLVQSTISGIEGRQYQEVEQAGSADG